MSAVVDFPIKPETRPYFDAFADTASEPGWLRKARRVSLNRFAETGFPTRRSENWRYLDLQELQRQPLLPTRIPPPQAMLTAGEQLAHVQLSGSRAGTRLVLVDGCFSPKLSTINDRRGVFVCPMSSATISDQCLFKQAADTDSDNFDCPFAALNGAFFADGYIVSIQPDYRLDEPIEIAHLISGAAEASFHTRSLINLGAGAHATIIETYAGEGKYWRNDVAAWRLDEGAALTRIALVEESADAVHFGEVTATLGANAKLDAFALLLGGGTVRHEASVTLAGDNAECRIDGAFLVSGREEANIVTTIDHAALGGTTSELIKGVAAGRGHGAFQGKIVVREGAQQTDARQTSRNLILGRRAVIDTKPELEILADDVKCAHGASVGDLDEAALFYLRARGIPTDEARRLLVEGFLREPIEGIADPAIRDHLLRRLSLRLARLESE